MAIVDGELKYLSHEINGRLHGAWYRVTADERVEIYWHARIASAPCDTDSPKLKALKLLHDLVKRWERPDEPRPSKAAPMVKEKRIRG